MEYVGECTKLEANSMSDNICPPIFHNLEEGDLQKQLLSRFDNIIEKIDKNVKTWKLIENVEAINNGEVLLQSIEKAELDNSILTNGKESENNANKCKNNEEIISHKIDLKIAYDYMQPY